METFHTYMASSATVCAGHCLIPKWLWYFTKVVVILHYVEHMIGSGRFHNLDFFKSVDSLESQIVAEDNHMWVKDLKCVIQNL